MTEMDLFQGSSLGSFGSLRTSSHLSLGDTSASALGVTYLCSRRADVLLALDDMLRVRGGFGPDIVQEIFGCIDILPALNSSSTNVSVNEAIGVEGSIYSVDALQQVYTSSEESHNQVIDTELALETAFVQLMRRLHRIREIESHLFGRHAIQEVTNATVVMQDDNPEMDDMYKAESLIMNLGKLKTLLLACVRNDPQRTGSISMQSFKSSMYQISSQVFQETQEWRLDRYT